MNLDLTTIVTWIETNPEAAGVGATLILGLLGYFGGAFAWLAGLFKSKPPAPPTQQAGDGGVNVGGDNSGTITTNVRKGADDG